MATTSIPTPAPIDFNKFTDPFPEHEVEWRANKITKSRRCQLLAYVTSRAVQRRLDDVVGPANWQSIPHVTEHGVVCHLSIRVNGEWVTKADGAQPTSVEPFKGAISDALKRSAVLWGIGRYLYDLPDTWVDILDKRPDGPHIDVRVGDGDWGYVIAPSLGAAYVPGGPDLLRKLAGLARITKGETWAISSLEWLHKKYSVTYDIIDDVPLRYVEELIAAAEAASRSKAA
jgi:hypothetical protein